MNRLLMARKCCRSIVCSHFPESRAVGWLRRDSGVSNRGVSRYHQQVPVDNENLWRLDYRVAKATTVFYVERIHTGGSFPPNICASGGALVSPQAVPTGYLGRNLSRLMQWFSAIRDSNPIECVIQMTAEMNQ